MPNLYARNVPRDLMKRLKDLKKRLDCKTWVTLFYEVDRIVQLHLREEERSRHDY